MKIKHKNKYICEYKSNYCVSIRVNEVALERYFSIKILGGKKKALNSARKWRDSILKKYNIQDRMIKKHSCVMFTQRKIPIIGVSKVNHYGYEAWTVCYSLRGYQYKKSFSINKYGENRAFLLACQIRYKHYGRIRIVDKKLCPCLPQVPYCFLKKWIKKTE